MGRLRTLIFIMAAFPVVLCAVQAAELQSPGASQQTQLPPPQGNAKRGKELFTAYKCYACHGHEGLSGLRRLVPMRLTQEAFVGFVQHSSLPAMPGYKGVPDSDLIDVYAYLRSVKVDTPSAEDIPLLHEIEQRAAKQ